MTSTDTLARSKGGNFSPPQSIGLNEQESGISPRSEEELLKTWQEIAQVLKAKRDSHPIIIPQKEVLDRKRLLAVADLAGVAVYDDKGTRLVPIYMSVRARVYDGIVEGIQEALAASATLRVLWHQRDRLVEKKTTWLLDAIFSELFGDEQPPKYG